MTTSLDPRRTLREFSLGMAAIIPIARQSASSTPDAINIIADARRAQDAYRRFEPLPWTAVLDVSSRHLRADELDALRAGAPPCPFVLSMANDHAWLLHCPAHAAPDALDPKPLGPGLAALYQFAADLGFSYVRVDEDALPIGTLEVYP